MKNKALHIIILIFTVVYTFSQDPQFSQFYASPLYLGPSFAGAIDGSRISGIYRNQWFDLPNSFVAYGFSYDHYFSTFNSGIGILFLKDAAGTSQLGATSVGLHYSYNFKVYNTWHIRPGISFSYLEHGFNGDLDFIDGILHPDGGTSAPVQTRNNARDIDAGFSALVYTKKIWFGSTADHLLTPNISLMAAEALVPLKISVYGGYEFRRKGKLLKPSDETMTFTFIYKQQEAIRQLDLGVYWYGYPWVLGMWYRGIPVVNSHRGDAMVFLAGIKTEFFNIGYSYDFTISNLLAYTKGSHEITAAFKFLLPKRSKREAVPCPEF